MTTTRDFARFFDELPCQSAESGRYNDGSSDEPKSFCDFALQPLVCHAP